MKGQLICGCREAFTGCNLTCSKWKSRDIVPDKIYVIPQWAKEKVTPPTNNPCND